VQPLFQSKINKYFIFWVCACTLRHIRCNANGLFGCTTFPHYLINGTIFEKKTLLNIKCVFSFSLLSEYFSLCEGKSEVLTQMCIGLHVKYPLLLSDFNETWIFWTDVRKILKYQILWKSVQWERSCSMRIERQKERRPDGHDESNSHFSQFYERV
jgi:hypothetical protein